VSASARVRLDPRVNIGTLDRRLFGSFVEHLDRCVYTGIFEPGHPTSDAQGFRHDVIDLVRELGATVIRYPGGNFVSNYRWEDGVGAKATRPRRRDLAWGVIDDNTMGTDEFVDWCQVAGVEPMLALNLGTRGLEDAIDQLEYTNGSGTSLADQRGANGHPDPHDVRLWCLGNEMDGPWQIGHKTATEYGRLATEVARAYKAFDRDLELVACGSSNRQMATFGSWEREVLLQCHKLVDFVSLHAYYHPVDGDRASYLASAADMDAFIDGVVATADSVAAELHSDKRIDLSFDEWNVWFSGRTPRPAEEGADLGGRRSAGLFDTTDAVVVGSLLISLLNHADRVRVACQAQLVNLLAPIVTIPGGPAWRQTIFHPFALTARHAHDSVLIPQVECDAVQTDRFGDVPQLHVAATVGAGAASLFAVNRSPDESLDVTVDLRAFTLDGPSLELAEHLCVSGPGDVANTLSEPDAVTPQVVPGTQVVNDLLTATLPPASWHVITLK
jgi:alpha-N-arabinofuranosidase